MGASSMTGPLDMGYGGAAFGVPGAYAAGEVDSAQGCLTGVGVGPGDPQLMTLAALRAIEECQVVAAPVTSKGHMAALDIATAVVDIAGKEVLPLEFSMAPSDARGEYERAAQAIERHLDRGLDVTMLTLGDVSLYSTFSRVEEMVRAAGYRVRAIPGISTPSALGAALLGVGFFLLKKRRKRHEA